MRVLKLIVIFAAALALPLAGFALYRVYDLHSQDYCIAKKRYTTDKEMFLSAMAVQGAYLGRFTEVENLYELGVNDGARTGGKPSYRTIYSSDKAKEERKKQIARYNSYSDYSQAYNQDRKDKISRLLSNPEYIARCCKRVEPDPENGGKLTGFKRFRAVLFGRSPLLVRVRFERIAANPDHYDPPLFWNAERKHWETHDLNTKLKGPPSPESRIQREHRKYFFVKMDVCGQAIIEKD